ncbi:MAG: DUF4097 family beta strand repeat-containing protein [Tissierellia bacterium]|nr:DUF4097 family beta strand repeat-containing protein [Tissierellia bacterium]
MKRGISTFIVLVTIISMMLACISFVLFDLPRLPQIIQDFRENPQFGFSNYGSSATEMAYVESSETSRHRSDSTDWIADLGVEDISKLEFHGTNLRVKVQMTAENSLRIDYQQFTGLDSPYTVEYLDSEKTMSITLQSQEGHHPFGNLDQHDFEIYLPKSYDQALRFYLANSDLTLDGSFPDLEVEIDNGMIQGNINDSNMVVDLANGELALLDVENSDIDATVHNGDIYLDKDEDMNAVLELDASNGDVYMDQETSWELRDGENRIKLGSGAHKVILKVNNGDIHLD